MHHIGATWLQRNDAVWTAWIKFTEPHVQQWTQSFNVPSSVCLHHRTDLSQCCFTFCHSSFFKHLLRQVGRSSTVFDVNTSWTFHTERPSLWPGWLSRAVIHLTLTPQRHFFLFTVHQWPLQHISSGLSEHRRCWIYEMAPGQEWTNVLGSYSLLFSVIPHSLSSPLNLSGPDWKSWGCFWKTRRGSCARWSLTLTSPSSMWVRAISLRRETEAPAFIYSTLSLITHPRHCEICIRIWSAGNPDQWCLCVCVCVCECGCVCVRDCVST